MFQESAGRKRRAKRAAATRSSPLERKRVLQRARELDAMSDGSAPRGTCAGKAALAEIACDTRRAFAFFAAMRPRLARRPKAELRGRLSLLRVRSASTRRSSRSAREARGESWSRARSRSPAQHQQLQRVERRRAARRHGDRVAGAAARRQCRRVHRQRPSRRRRRGL